MYMVATGENLGNFTLTQGKKPGKWSIAMATIKYGCYPLRSLWNIWDRTEITMDLSRTEILLCIGRRIIINYYYPWCRALVRYTIPDLLFCFCVCVCVCFFFCFLVFVFVSHWSIHFEIIFQGLMAWIWVMSTILSTVWKKKKLLLI